MVDVVVVVVVVLDDSAGLGLLQEVAGARPDYVVRGWTNKNIYNKNIKDIN